MQYVRFDNIYLSTKDKETTEDLDDRSQNHDISKRCAILCLLLVHLPRFVSWSQGRPPEGTISDKVGTGLSNHATCKEKM